MDTQREIRQLFLQALKSLSFEYKGSSLTDIFMLIDKESGELSIYDDEENNIVNGIIQEWENVDDTDSFDYVAIPKEVLIQLNGEGFFDSLDIYKPFSINYADNDFVVIEELLVIEDDSIIRLEDDFLKRMDQEFDDFLDKLLKE